MKTIHNPVLRGFNPSPSAALASVAPTRLGCEYRVDPMGVDSPSSSVLAEPTKIVPVTSVLLTEAQ